MSRCFNSFWFRNSMLLVALAGGWLATLVVPSYEQMAALYHGNATSKSAQESHNPHHTGVEIDHHRLQYVRSAS